MNDIVNGRISCEEVLLSEWVDLSCMAMIDGRQPHLNLDIPHGGGLYSFHHCITTITAPVSARTIRSQVQ